MDWAVMVTIRNIDQDHVSPSSNYLANKSVSYLHSSALKSTKFFVYILSSKFSVLCLCNAMRQYHSELKIKNVLAKELFAQVHTAIHIHKAKRMECNANNSIDFVHYEIKIEWTYSLGRMMVCSIQITFDFERHWNKLFDCFIFCVLFNK